eukprot:scaffold178899_cov37-Prasinocladus_malaysianus.AAC.1
MARPDWILLGTVIIEETPLVVSYTCADTINRLGGRGGLDVIMVCFVCPGRRVPRVAEQPPLAAQPAIT